MAVLITNNQKKRKIAVEKVRTTAQALLDVLGYPESELSILIVDDNEIADLNSRYLGRTGSTNVIAFPMLEGEYSEVSEEMLGDVVISADTTQKEADEGGVDFETRFDELLVHGMLHLLGYDHERDEEQAEEMEKKNRELLNVTVRHQ